jgi:polysaccharide export outer membrane protein
VSGEVVVRPDGKITLPVGNDIMASGLTTEQLRTKVNEELQRCCFKDVPDITIQVKTVNSRKVFISGYVAKVGPFALTGPMDILQLVTTAGGMLEFADKKNVMLIRTTNGVQQAIRINYDDIEKGKNLAKNNLQLQPGDRVIVR